jgi:hypothetical protein
MERPLRRSGAGRAHWGTRGVTIVGIQPDRIVQGRLYIEHAGRPGGKIDQAVRRATTTAWLFRTASERWRLPWSPSWLPAEILLRNYAVEAAARPVETGLAYDLPRDWGRGMLA